MAFSYALDWVIGRFVHLDEQQIVGWIDDLGILGPIAYMLLLASTIILTPLPSVVVDIAGGLAFGTALGTVYTIAGAMLGATVNFYIARRLGRGLLERRLKPRTLQLIDGLAERLGGRGLFVMRLEPLASADHATVIAAIAPNLQRYLTGPLEPSP